MRDVEQAGGAARVGVLGDDAVAILHRHLVAGERHQPGAAPHMQRMQRRMVQPGCFRRRLRRSFAGRRGDVAVYAWLGNGCNGGGRRRRVSLGIGRRLVGQGRHSSVGLRGRMRERPDCSCPSAPPLSRNLRDFAAALSPCSEKHQGRGLLRR